jgi:hypothetical protein
MSDRADNAGAQVEVDDLHKVRAVFRTSDYSGAQAELEAELRDADESLFVGRLSGARSRVRCASRCFDERHGRFLRWVMRLAGNKRPGRRLWTYQPDAQAREPAVSSACLGRRPSLARRVRVAGIRSPCIDAIARNRSILG